MSKSVGKFFLLLIPALITGLQTGCRSKPVPQEPPPSVQVRDELQDEISLKSDREHLSELRKEIPEQKKQANDELALVLQLMGEVKLKPSEVSSRYQTAIQKRRGVFREKVHRLREDFRKVEVERRTNFMSEQKAEREKFSKRKAKREKVARFYQDLDRKRKDFFTVEHERRKDFEAEVATQSKDFDSYMREKHKEFSEQQRLYSKRYDEVELEKRKTTQASPPTAVPAPPTAIPVKPADAFDAGE